jgi:hypothetical protein
MKDIKAQAEKARRFWASAAITSGGAALVFGTVSNVPHPAVKVVSVFFATIFGALGLFESYQAEMQSRIVADPPDRRWRIIARPPTTYPGRLGRLMPRGLSSSQAAAGRRFAAATLRSAALAQCVAWSIDRGTTALAVRRPTYAARQYRAGAACARSNASLLASMPALATPLVDMARSVDEQYRSTSGAPNRRAIAVAATRQYGALGRLGAFSPPRLIALRRAAIRRASTAPGTPPVPPSAVLEQVAAQSASQVVLMRAAATALSRAAGGPLR